MSGSNGEVRLALEQPDNSLLGLKVFWPNLRAALVVAPIALTFGLAIAQSSESPNIMAGLVSSIVAGFVVTMIRGSNVNIYGPAAGLAPILVWAALVLGDKDIARGYKFLPYAFVAGGVVQIILARFKAANLAAAFPPWVVEGMMGAVGCLIIAKQLPVFLGIQCHAHDFFGILREVATSLAHVKGPVLGLGITCLIALLFLDYAKKTLGWRWLKFMPPPLIVLVLGVASAQVIGLNSQYLITVPDKAFQFVVPTPDFSGHSMWYWAAMFVEVVFVIVMVDATETLATTASVRRQDVFKRKVNSNRVLFENGVANFFSAIFGGLTIIPGGVKSRTNIEAGGVTTNVNLYVAVLLVGFVLLGKGLIGMIPFTVLAAVLIHIGIKLVMQMRHSFAVGFDQACFFVITMVTAVWLDLFLGVLIGMTAKFVLHACRNWQRGGHLTGILRSSVLSQGFEGDTWVIRFHRPITCFNTPILRQVLDEVPADAKVVWLVLESGVTMVDHTAQESIHEFLEDRQSAGLELRLIGFDRLIPRTAHPRSPLLAPLPQAT